MDKAMVIIISAVGDAFLAGEIAIRSKVIPTIPTTNAERRGINRRGILIEYKATPINPPKITNSPWQRLMTLLALNIRENPTAITAYILAHPKP